MKDFLFFRGYIKKNSEVISQHEYNLRRDVMAQEEYQRNYYEQMRRLDELLENQRVFSQQRWKLKINPPFWVKIKMFFQKIYISLLYGN